MATRILQCNHQSPEQREQPNSNRMCLKCNPGARPCFACSTTREVPSSANRTPISTRASLRLRRRCDCLWRDVARRHRRKGGRGHLYSRWGVITPEGTGLFLRGRQSLPAVPRARTPVLELYNLCTYFHNFYPYVHVYIRPSFYYPCVSIIYLSIYQPQTSNYRANHYWSLTPFKDWFQAH